MRAIWPGLAAWGGDDDRLRIRLEMAGHPLHAYHPGCLRAEERVARRARAIGLQTQRKLDSLGSIFAFGAPSPTAS